ncbi:FmdB family zinc ribbon protein [Nesterenkonia sp. YGD6]|uniref:FmdB family zinc ribbon protein n=1 Tax=Nesterenkonia sp. YGD6 TaxID=2901231 RepID=UPI00406D240F
MPLYSFRCDQGCSFDASYTMDEVPRKRACQQCDASAVRIITSVNLSRAGTAAFRAVESSLRSAHEPDVVSKLPHQAGRSTPITTNPLHATLPRT